MREAKRDNKLRSIGTEFQRHKIWRFIVGKRKMFYLVQVCVLCAILPTCSTAQELSLKLSGFSNTSTPAALSDRLTDLKSFNSDLLVIGGEYAHRLSDKWSVYTAVSICDIGVFGNEGPLRWPAEVIAGVYVDDESWPNYREVAETGRSLVLSLGGRRYLDIGKKSLVPFVSMQADLQYNYIMHFSERYYNKGIRSGFSPRLQPQFNRTPRESIDKHKTISAGIVALVGIELRIATLIKLRGGWAVRADLLDYARNVDYLRTFARGITLQAGINLSAVRRTFFPKKDKEVDE